ncbi:MAG TPA: hypothetical protein VMB80_18130 [Candidatus Acidoferrum sp.]|nr:hypothetical protein [Candidatus Acidoferrum sp.]
MRKIILIGICIALELACVSARATDTPVQAAARAALMQKLNSVTMPTPQPTLKSNAPSGKTAAEPIPAITSAPPPASEPAPPPPAPVEAPTPAPEPAPAPVSAPAIPAAPEPAAEPAPEPATPVAAEPARVEPAPAVPAPAAPAPVIRETVSPEYRSELATGSRAKGNYNLALVLLAALVPLMAFAGATLWHRRQRTHPDQSLRSAPAASALVRARALQADQMVERIENDIFAACGSCALAVVGPVLISVWLSRPLSVVVSTIFLAGFGGWGGFLMFRAMRRFQAVQNIRLAPVAQPPAVSRGEPVAAKERQGKFDEEPAPAEPSLAELNPKSAASKEPAGNSNGRPVIPKEKTARRRRTVSTRSKARQSAPARNGAAKLPGTV